ERGGAGQRDERRTAPQDKEARAQSQEDIVERLMAARKWSRTGPRTRAGTGTAARLTEGVAVADQLSGADKAENERQADVDQHRGRQGDSFSQPPLVHEAMIASLPLRSRRAYRAAAGAVGAGAGLSAGDADGRFPPPV